MSCGEHYRIVAPTIALERLGEVTQMVHIPTGATITIQGESSAGARLMDVLWGHRVVMMFTRDIRERGRLLMPTNA